ncbi:MAG: hypothetical protein K2Y02_07485 [Burkholderiaceae bacterium]|nr:hypothetical protein [Burkholderiaceae bacterium]
MFFLLRQARNLTALSEPVEAMRTLPRRPYRAATTAAPIPAVPICTIGLEGHAAVCDPGAESMYKTSSQRNPDGQETR